MANELIDGGSHVDAALSNIAVEAFNGGGDFVAGVLFPSVPVEKQSDLYYVIDSASWLQVPDTARAPKTSPKMGHFKVSSETYFAQNYAFATDNAKETLSNADRAIQIRERSARYVVDVLNRDREVRVANKVTSISNVGSGVSLTGGNKWSDYVNSDPISDVNTAHAFIENQTGLVANTALMDKDTYRILRFHPAIRDYMKYTGSGPVPDAVLQEVFEVQRILIARGVKNTANEGAAATLANIWGNNFLLCRIESGAASTQTKTLGLGFNWMPEGFPAGMAVERYDAADPGKKAEIIAANYFHDEKIVARDLGYLIAATL